VVNPPFVFWPISHLDHSIKSFFRLENTEDFYFGVFFSVSAMYVPENGSKSFLRGLFFSEKAV